MTDIDYHGRRVNKPKEIDIRKNHYDLINEDICWLINNGRITTSTNVKKVGVLMVHLKWLEGLFELERNAPK